MMSYKEVRREDMEYLFPELKESEDEDIRKELINFVKSRLAGFPQCEKYIAWLEKQGEKNPAEWHIEDEQNLNACLGYIPDEILRRWLKDVIHAKYDKPINKLEAKFHEGDFIKHNKANLIYKVISVNSGSYCVENIETSSRVELFNAEQDFHLWTIKDAKDGDVLCLGGVIAIFKKYIGQEKCICYCSFCDNGGFEIPIENGEDNVYGCTDTTPATKEQRAILFAKMKEAGYECDKDINNLKSCKV